MPRFLVCPDSCKGVMAADDAARVMEDAIRTVFPEAVVDSCPMADGGEGTLTTWAKATSARVADVSACDPFGNPVVCQVAIREEAGEVLLEAAQTCGLPPPAFRDPGRMLSTGLGMAMREVLRRWPEARVHVALGGTGTVDGGLGAAMALGLRVFSGSREIRPSGPLDIPGDLRLEFSDPFRHPPVFLCDTQAPLLGPAGAVALFGAQKGVRASEASAFERVLENLANAAARAAGRDFTDAAGFGAAGGMAVVFAFLCRAACVPGARTLMRLLDFERRVRQADAVLTAEGRLDATSFTGKLVGEVHDVCRKAQKPLWVFPGQSEVSGIPGDVRVFPTSPGGDVPDPGIASRNLFHAVVSVLHDFRRKQLP